MPYTHTKPALAINNPPTFFSSDGLLWVGVRHGVHVSRLARIHWLMHWPNRYLGYLLLLLWLCDGVCLWLLNPPTTTNHGPDRGASLLALLPGGEVVGVAETSTPPEGGTLLGLVVVPVAGSQLIASLGSLHLGQVAAAEVGWLHADLLAHLHRLEVVRVAATPTVPELGASCLGGVVVPSQTVAGVADLALVLGQVAGD